jgi:hypothetical protein
MARKVEVSWWTTSTAARPRRRSPFGLDGTGHEIDLNAKHAKELRKALDVYIGSARRVGRSGVTTMRRSRTSTKDDVPRTRRSASGPSARRSS